jgi:hypothetical protein
MCLMTQAELAQGRIPTTGFSRSFSRAVRGAGCEAPEPGTGACSRGRDRA